MDDTRWIIGLGLPIVLALGGTIWAMLRSRIERGETALEKALGEHRAALTKVEGRFEQWIRDREVLDREFRHEEFSPAMERINRELYPLVKQVEHLEAELDKLREWRHMKGDPYVGALDAIKKQIDQLEARMNGYLKREGR